jgi:hypothetical protein
MIEFCAEGKSRESSGKKEGERAIEVTSKY